jgi:hypothetical protein
MSAAMIAPMICDRMYPTASIGVVRSRAPHRDSGVEAATGDVPEGEDRRHQARPRSSVDEQFAPGALSVAERRDRVPDHEEANTPPARRALARGPWASAWECAAGTGWPGRSPTVFRDCGAGGSVAFSAARAAAMGATRVVRHLEAHAARLALERFVVGVERPGRPHSGQ